MVANDLADGCEAKACPSRTGREKRLEKSTRHRLVETGTVVGDDQMHVAAGGQVAVAEGARLIELLCVRHDTDATGAFHRLCGVLAQVENDLLHVRRLADHREIGRHVRDDEFDP
jgi:hypothetical protein